GGGKVGGVGLGKEELWGLRNEESVPRGLVRTHQIVKPLRDMTVADNVRVGVLYGRLRLRGAKARERVDEVLTRTQLTHRAQAKAGVLSIGELKRLEIARPLATGPAGLCLAEAMGGLNP